MAMSKACEVCGEAHERYPGRFEGNTCAREAEAFDDVTLDGCHDDEHGDVEAGGWFALVTDADGIPGGSRHAVVSVDSQGFIDVATFDTADEARAAFEGLRDEEEGEAA